MKACPSLSTATAMPQHNTQSFFARLLSKLQRFFPGPGPLTHTKHKAQRRPRQQRLPAELLARIFLAAADWDPSDASYDLVPFTVSHVCRLWRIIALHTPALWRRVPLVFSSYMEGQQNILHARVLRSSSAPLDVCLRPHRAMRVWGWVRAVPQRLDAHGVERAIKSIVSSTHRWRSLEIVFTAYQPHLIKASLSGLHYRNALLLADMKLVFRGNDDATEFYLFAGFAPHLRRLVIDGIRIAWLPTLFGGLTFLDYRHHAFSEGEHAAWEILNALRACPALRELRVLFPQHKALATDATLFRRPPAVPAALKNLVSLQLRVDGDDIPRALILMLASLRMPALRTLDLIDLGRHRKPFPSLKAFHRVSPCSFDVGKITGAYGFAANGGRFVSFS
ncbi:hypothetical protein C8F01DRAFT_1016170 [Mycena amicta]|nr:hypothetical protein C8F01DRAFT_1016170 [Mycena amicta]